MLPPIRKINPDRNISKQKSLQNQVIETVASEKVTKPLAMKTTN